MRVLGADVRYWPLADIGWCAARPLSGVKWTLVLDIEEHYAAIHPELPAGPRDLLKQYIKEGPLGLKTEKGFYTDYQQ